MSGQVRMAGWGTAPDGSEVTWTIAEGRQGRRWRETVTRDGLMRHALLLETGPDRRFRHLELASAAGLWTFHPEPDGTLHGNHVSSADRVVTHTVGLPFGPDDLLVIEGSVIAVAAIAWRLDDAGFAVGASVDLAGVRLDPANGHQRVDHDRGPTDRANDLGRVARRPDRAR